MDLRYPVSLVLLAAVSLGGCAMRSEFQAFANLGEDYTESLQPIFKVSCETQIDASTWKLIQMADSDGAPEATVDRFNASDRAWCDQLDRLSAHVALLQQYFAQLSKLAKTNRDDGYGSAAKGTFEQVLKVGKKVRADFNLRITPKMVAAITNAAVNAKIGSLLRNELIARKDALAQEFVTLEEALKVLETDQRALVKQISDIRTQLLVTDPLVGGRIANPLAAVPARRFDILGETEQEKALTAIEAAKKAAAIVTGSFEVLISEDPGSKVTLQRLGDLGKELSALKSVVAALQTA